MKIRSIQTNGDISKHLEVTLDNVFDIEELYETIKTINTLTKITSDDVELHNAQFIVGLKHDSEEIDDGEEWKRKYGDN